MGVYYKNRVWAISLALAAGGILTCGMVLAKIFLPRGSAIAVFVSIPLLGAVVLGVLVAFAWACELLDRRGGIRFPARTACKPRERWLVVSTRGPDLATIAERQPATKPAMPLWPLIDYPVNLRGRMHFPGNRRSHGWHGQ